MEDHNNEWYTFFKEYIGTVKSLYKEQFKPFTYMDDLNIDDKREETVI